MVIMRSPARFLLAALAAALLPTASAWAVPARLEVKFLESDKFSDAGWRAEDRQQVLNRLEAHLQSLAKKRLAADQHLLLEVLDVDLAGELRPPGARMDQVRVMRSVTWPRIEIRYTLSSGDQVLRQATVHLQDMAYLGRITGYAEGDSLRYEKTMLDDWFKKEFGAAGAKR